MRRRAILFMPDYPDEKRAKTVDAAAFFKDAKLGINEQSSIAIGRMTASGLRRARIKYA